MIDFLTKKNILIFGLAREGISTLNFLRSHGVTGKLWAADDKALENLEDYAKQAIENDKKIEFIHGLELTDDKNLHFDQVFLTPGTPLERLPIGLQRIAIGQTTIFLQKFAKQTIGVTGTKGKSTTASLIYDILTKAGKDVVLVGNIGLPPLDFYDQIAEKTIAVFELSSHQLSLAKSSPHVAVFLNIFPEHLDYYKTFYEYFQAKAHIAEFQGKNDHFVLNGLKGQEIVSDLLKTSPAHTHPIVEKSIQEVSGWKTKLLGDFNRFNIAVAWEVAKIYGVDEESARQAVLEFKPLEHRLEKVGIFHEITFYNDSISTLPESTIAALNTFGDQLDTLLIGGFDRGLDYGKLAERISESRIRNLVLFPETGNKMLAALKDREKYQILETISLEEAVKFAYQNTKKGKVVLLSPGSPSFNLFKDYRDRGNQFKDWIVKLGK